MADEPLPIGTVTEITGLPGKWRVVSHGFDYKRSACECPHCGGLGFSWNGWFSCDGHQECRVKALVETGEVFIPDRISTVGLVF